jgi:single stranded DNA-binding protein
MPDRNVVTIEGRLTRDPDLFAGEGRVPVSLLRIACNRRRQNRDTGVWEEHPRFFDVRVYGSGAEEVAFTFGKGEKVLVEEGHLDWYEKGAGAERREFVSIVARSTPDGITRVGKREEQSPPSAE